MDDFQYHFPSWTMEEYQHACQSNALWNTVVEEAFWADHTKDHGMDQDVALEEKYIFAGHSAQFMFRQSLDQVKENLD